MTPNVIMALIAGFFSSVVALIVGYFKYRTDREKNKNDLTTSVWDQFRKDNDLLTKKVNDCRIEIEKLDEKLDRALEETKTHKAEREKAEEACKAAQKRATAAEEASAKWEAAYHGEHAAYSLLHHLYDELREGRAPDAAMLETIQSRLVELASPPVVTVVPAIVPTP